MLILIDRRRILRPGRIFVLYIDGYFCGRLWVESLRSDDADDPYTDSHRWQATDGESHPDAVDPTARSQSGARQ